VAELAGYSFHLARGDDLDLCVDLMSFYALFDDPFDGPLGRDPLRAADVCARLVNVLHDPSCLYAMPLTSFFADIWRRSLERASRSWECRAKHNWEYYFSTSVGEAADRVRAIHPPLDHVLQVRRGTSATLTVVDYIELTGGQPGALTMRPVVFHMPQLRILRDIAADVPLLLNDVHSLAKEERCGDVDNVVLAVETERMCSRAEAIGIVHAMIMEKTARFIDVEAQIPQMCGDLDLPEAEHEDVARYADGLRSWIRGYHEWERETARYTLAGQLPVDQPNYLENPFDH
jgi:avermitilol synthase